MADSKISALTAGTDAQDGDLLVMVDVSDTSQAASGTTKQLTKSTLLNKGTLTSNSPEQIQQTWNSGGTTFTALKMSVTNTNSAPLSRLLDLQVDGASKAAISKDSKLWLGLTPASNNYLAYGDGTNSWINAPTGGYVHFGINDAWGIAAHSASLRLTGTHLFGWTNSNPVAPLDTGLARNAAGVVEFNNGTSGTLRDWKARRAALTEYADISSMTAPAAPAAGTARFYADTSGGKVRLMVIFPTGAAQQIAIEP